MPLKYRRDQSFPLTNDDVDNNFQFLYDEVVARLLIDDYTPESVRLKLIASPNQGEMSQINSSLVRGAYPSKLSVANTIVQRDENKDIIVRNVTGNLFGNADTSTLASRATIANNVDGVVAVANGGTGATNPFDARDHIRAVCLDGDTMLGKLTLAPAAAGYASFNIPGGEEPTNPVHGDFWVAGGKLKGKVNGTTKIFAFTDSNITGTSANVTGVVAVANGGTGANNAADARNNLGAAPIVNPTFSGTVNAPTVSITDNSTKVATTAYTQGLIASKVAVYWTSTQTSNEINSRLANYTNTTTLTGSLDAINTELDGLRVYVDQQDALKLNKAGGTLTGPLTLSAAPTQNLHASTKKYVDDVRTELYDNIGTIPVGTVMHFAANTAPVGWMVCNGATLSTAAYPSLFAIIGYTYGGSGNTFKLPDLRGEFLRGFDGGRNVDEGRGFGSWQKGSIVPYDPSFSSVSPVGLVANNDNYTDIPTRAKQVWKGGFDCLDGSSTTKSHNLYNETYLTHASGGAGDHIATNYGGWEVGVTRPRNVAMLPCIKAFGGVDDADLLIAQEVIASVATKVSKTGDTMTGRLTLSHDPVSAMHAVTKQYVDAQVAAGDAGDIVITSGNSQSFNGGNYFDVYPPAGKNMSKLKGFIPSLASGQNYWWYYGYYGNWYDYTSVGVRWLALSDRIRVYAPSGTWNYSTANWLAIWR